MSSCSGYRSSRAVASASRLAAARTCKPSRTGVHSAGVGHSVGLCVGDLVTGLCVVGVEVVGDLEGALVTGVLVAMVGAVVVTVGAFVEVVGAKVGAAVVTVGEKVGATVVIVGVLVVSVGATVESVGAAVEIVGVLVGAVVETVGEFVVIVGETVVGV